MRNALWLVLVPSMLAFSGCARSSDGDAGEDDAPAPTDVAALDVPSGLDAPLDTPPDVPLDVPVDVRFFVDVPIRGDAFVPIDAPIDVGLDAPRDAGLDVGRDAGGGATDAGRDAPTTMPDAPAVGCAADPDATIAAVLRVTSDDSTVVHLNGVLLDATPYVWSSPQTYPVTLFVHPDRANVLAIEGVNTHPPIDGPDRGTLIDLSVGAAHLVSDGAWRASTTMASGWSDPTFADGAWGAAVEEGPHGMPPWGAVLGTSAARWIWSYDSDLPAGDKTTLERVYFRRTFYVAEDGTLSDLPAGCP